MFSYKALKFFLSPTTLKAWAGEIASLSASSALSRAERGVRFSRRTPLQLRLSAKQAALSLRILSRKGRGAGKYDTR